MIDVAFLRVYRPAQRVRLPVSTGSGDLPRLGAATLTTESQVADAWEVEWRDAVWRCPRVPRRRMLESLVAFHQATNRLGVGIIDSTVAESARRELAHIRSGVSEPASVMVSAWHPPLRWFIVFTYDDQVEPMLLRTGLAEAEGRAKATVEAMRAIGLPSMWVDDIESLASWLGGFDGEGMVELDYRQVAWRSDELAADETVVDIQRSVAALLDGDVDGAVEAFGAAMYRWAAAQAVAYSS